MAGVDPDNNDIQIRIRVRDDALHDVTAKWPRVLSGPRTGIPSWMGEYAHLPWRRTLPTDLVLNETGLSGSATVRIAYNHEDWSLDVTREESIQRHLHPPGVTTERTSFSVGQLSGTVEQPEGSDQRVLALNAAAASRAGSELRNGEASQNLGLALTFAADGAAVRGVAFSGRVNTQPWVAIADGLTLADGWLTGELVVLVIDDQFFDYRASLLTLRDAAQAQGHRCRSLPD